MTVLGLAGYWTELLVLAPVIILAAVNAVSLMHARRHTAGMPESDRREELP